MEKYNLSDFIFYSNSVRSETEKVVHLLDGYDSSKRGLSGVTGSYHVDHIIPIRVGFLKNMDIKDISDISNLQFIPWEENNNRRKFLSNLKFHKNEKEFQSGLKKQIVLDGVEYDYFIHDTGFVESKRSGRILYINVKSNGYSYVCLWKNCKSKTMLVHRLVALHFIPNIDMKSEVNHIDGDKNNNHFLNLEWVTSSENKKHCYLSGLASHLGEKNKQSKLSELDIFEIRNSSLSRKEISVMYNISKSHVDRILRKESWSHI